MIAFLGLGANLGDAQAALRGAVQAMRQWSHSRVLAVSSLYASAPVGAEGPDYLNAVAKLDTKLDAHALLAAMQAIENEAGRERPYRYAPRTLDLDLLLYGDLQRNDPLLTLPHPRMGQRAFVLRPLHELAPERVGAAQLAQVQDQRIHCVQQGPAWAGGVC